MNLKIIFTFITRFGSAILNFVIAIILSQVLGAEGKGEASLLVLNISIVTLLTNIMGGASLVFLVPRFSVFTLAAVSYGWVLFSALLFYGISRLFPFAFFDSFTGHVFLLSLILSLFHTNSNILLGLKKSALFNTLNFLLVAVNVAVLATAFYGLKHETIEQYTWSLYAAYGVPFIISFFFLIKEIAEYKLVNVKEIIQRFIKHGGYIQLANVAQLLTYRASFYFIKHYSGDKDLGIYSNAIALAESVWLVTRSISTVQYAETANTSSKEKNISETNRLAKINLLLTSAAMAVLCLLPDGLYTWLFGRDFTGIQQMMWLMAAGIVAFSHKNILAHFFSGTGLNHYNFIVSFAGMLGTLALAYFLIPMYGLVGAAITLSAVYFGDMLLAQWLFSVAKNKL